MKSQQPGAILMRASAISKKGAASFEELKPACQILIVHEDFSAYTRAVEVCRRVMERFASELDFDLKCWNFIELADPNCARHAAKTAGMADIILLSVRAPLLPPEFDRWLEVLSAARSKPEGVLALAMDTDDGPTLLREKLFRRLTLFSERLGMDFISFVPGDETAVINLQPVITAHRQLRP
jgi:hypothetical protein